MNASLSSAVPAATSSPLRVLVVDDEALARSRLRSLLADIDVPRSMVVAEAADAVQAMQQVQHLAPDLVLLDIHMPGTDGLALARAIQALPHPPALIFVTAHAEHAVDAFEVEALDYLTKPVRLERLRTALHKMQRKAATLPAAPEPVADDWLVIQDRLRTERIPVSEVIYFKAELKYITVRTALRSYILDGSLNELEEKYGPRFLRIHRNALIARHAARALERHHDAEEGEGWAVRLSGVDEVLLVSRRQLAAVREMLTGT